jgi:dTDP-4-dehydrorhamnose 3,5-epimerase-like enzyme
MQFSFKNTSINDVEEVSARVIGEKNDYLESFGDLRSQVKFENIFIVSSSADTERGQHAHLRATQYLFCLKGHIEVEMFDGTNSLKKVLRPKDYGLRIPRGIWAVQKFKSDSILIVISSEKYNEKEYVRDFTSFKKKKKIL